jgi:hypothetical protein
MARYDIPMAPKKRYGLLLATEIECQHISAIKKVWIEDGLRIEDDIR